MDKTSKLILKTLKKLDDYNYYWLDGDFPNDYFKSESEFFNSVEYLISEGYAKYISASGVHIGIHLTHEGVHKEEFERQKFWRAFFTHYLPGFISGIVSTIFSAVLVAYILSIMGT